MVHLIEAFTDNYIFLIELQNKEAVVIDPGTADGVRAFCRDRSLKLSTILLTHHHNDHIGGVDELRAESNCRVFGPQSEAHRLPTLDVGVHDRERLRVGGVPVEVLSVPGHTRGHIAFHFYAHQWLFCGDTLFSMGCGRLFEGTPDQMHVSLMKLKELPEDTLIYCAHEYTEKNARFSLQFEPKNKALVQRTEEVKALRQKQLPSIPVSLKVEKMTNPFLRGDSNELRKNLDLKDASDLQIFTRLRELRNDF